MKDIVPNDIYEMGRANRGNAVRVFDWDQAARIIKERQPDYAEAGLDGDWAYTGGAIWNQGCPVPKTDTYTYLASTWAMPKLMIDGDRIDCWIYESAMPAEWGTDGSHVYWPASALSIINAPQS